MGLPVELTAHEEAAEKAKQTEKEAAQRRLPVALKPISQLEKMREALVAVKKQAAGDEARATTAFQTMLKYIGNVAQVSMAAHSPLGQRDCWVAFAS